jgi:hypothetical protein
VHVKAGAQIDELPRSVYRVASIALVGAFVSFVVSVPDVPALADHLGPTVTSPTLGPGYALTDHNTYKWASAYYGPHATLRRYSYTLVGTATMTTVDVISNADSTDLVNGRPTIFYMTPTTIKLGYAPLDDGIVADVEISDPDTVLSPTDSAWVSVTWISGCSVSSQLCQSVSVFVPQAAGSGAPPIVRPSSKTTLSRPVGMLIRGPQASSKTTKPPAAVAAAVQAANLVIDHAEVGS